ncbi:serine/threonine protein kinase [Kwoniella mangroviensis CBS 8886]|nr:serine/threonine protein kinase [Kwoniella mangroviensis CBS 8886]
MSLLRDSPAHHAPSHDPCKPRSSSSRNDLFTTSWQPELPPPKPLSEAAAAAGPSTSSLNSIFDLGGIGGQSNALPTSMKKRGELGLKMDLEGISNSFARNTTTNTGGEGMGVDEFGVSTKLQNKSSYPTLDKNDISPSPRTSSFFDTPIESVTPPPAPRLVSSLNGMSSFAPSPLNLSRSSSAIRKVPAPLPLPVQGEFIDSGIAGPSRQEQKQKQRSNDSYTSNSSKSAIEDPLSPLHQSPQLPPSGSGGLEGWKPPLPPSSDDIELRLVPNSTYLLGEGRYAKAYLASYRRKRKNRYGHGYGGGDGGSASMQVNEDGDGLVGGSWRLCAAKRLAPDRESQTMGLREAFFLNRLTGPTKHSISADRNGHDYTRRIRPRQRAVSPLRGSHQPSEVIDTQSQKRKRPRGSVYVVKLIAVKEDIEGFPTLPQTQTHARSTSDVLSGTGSGTDSKPIANTISVGDLRRQRSSTIITAHAPLPPDSTGTLPSYPSLPSLAQSVRYDQHQSAPSLSRLVLLLEHAPLGTLDRMLRTSPQLVGRKLWERWAREGAEALEWVHGKGVVHADVKPGNLLLTVDLHIRLSDFGSSLLIHPAHPPTDGLGLGTLPFSPPELVDPTQTFSFPVDIFALGATLYQCLTGREPFRGIRTVEMMHHVRKGGLWAYEERERFQRVGNEDGMSTAGSPYPSAWRGYSNTSTTGAGYPSGSGNVTVGLGGGVRRAGSLRVPPSYSREHLAASVIADGHGVAGAKPKLKRMTSAERLRASDEATSSESPSGVKLYANWVKSGPYANSTSTSNMSTPGPGLDAVTRLLSDDDELDVTSPTYGISRNSSTSLQKSQAQEDRLSLKGSTSLKSESPTTIMTMNTSDLPKGMMTVQLPTPTSPCSDHLPSMDQINDLLTENNSVRQHQISLNEAYQDGSPSMLFLDGSERVSEEIRNVLKNMLNPFPENRMTALEVRMYWDELGLGLEDDDDDDGEGDD